VVTVHDVLSEDDRPWIVMELVRARSLQDVIDEDGPVTPRTAADIGRQVLAALNHAHQAGILHRDVKPSNVLITDEGRAVLTDFGIAQVEGDATLTQTGLVMGSPAYISPERVQGERAVPASDLWALGATLYAAVEGKAPYERSDAMTSLAAALTEEVAPPRNAGSLRRVLHGLLARDPAQRMTAETVMPLLIDVANQRVVSRPATPVGNATMRDRPATRAKPVALETVLDPAAIEAAARESTARENTAGGSTAGGSTAGDSMAFRQAPPRLDAARQEPARSPDEERTEVQSDWRPAALDPWQPTVRAVDQPGYDQPAYDSQNYERQDYERQDYERQDYDSQNYERQQYGTPHTSARARTVVIVLVAAILVAASLIVGALILKSRSSALGLSHHGDLPGSALALSSLFQPHSSTGAV
jgi:hypothetical protein